MGDAQHQKGHHLPTKSDLQDRRVGFPLGYYKGSFKGIYKGLLGV